MALTKITSDGITDGTITGTDLTTNVDLVDNQKIRFGTGNDLEIYHNGNNSFIVDQGTGSLVIQGSQTLIRNTSGHNQIVASNDVVELNYDNAKKFETKSDGIDVTGEVQCDSLDVDGAANISSVLTMQSYIQGTGTLNLYGSSSSSNGLALATNGNVTLQGDLDLQDNDKLLLGTGDDLEIYHDGSNSYVNNTGTGTLIMQGNGTDNVSLRAVSGESGVDVEPHSGESVVKIYHNGSQKIRTESGGIVVTGNVRVPFDGHKLIMGASQDLKIYHDGSHSYIEENGTGKLRIITSELLIGNPADDENIAKFIENGAVELYHDNSKKLETTSGGGELTGTWLPASDATGNFGSTSKRWGTVYATSFSGDGSNLTGISTDLVNDTSPQLGGNLDTNDHHILLDDNHYVYYGDGEDLRIGHDGTNSLIRNDTGELVISCGGSANPSPVKIQPNQGENSIVANHNGSVNLFYDGSKKLETTSGGITVTGSVICDTNFRGADNVKLSLGDAQDLEIDHDGTNNDINYSNGNLLIRQGSHSSSQCLQFDGNGHLYVPDNEKIYFGASADLQIYHDGSNSFIKDAGTGNLKVVASVFQVRNAADNETMIEAHDNGQVELYHNDTKVLNTANGGVQITDNLFLTDGDSGQNTDGGLRIGNSGDLKIYHNGTNSFVRNSQGQLLVGGSGGNLVLEALGDVRTMTWEGESMIEAKRNGAVELYHNNSKKLETTSGGIDVTGAITVNGSALTSGKILQVVTKRITGTTQYNSTSFGDVSGYDASITPSSTSSKIFVMFNLNAGSNNNGNRIKLRVTRTGDDSEFVGDASGSRTRCSAMFATSSPSDSRNTTIHYISTPSSTSQVTYQLQAKLQVGGGSQVFFGSSATDSNSSIEGRTANQITLMEVAG